MRFHKSILPIFLLVGLGVNVSAQQTCSQVQEKFDGISTSEQSPSPSGWVEVTRSFGPPTQMEQNKDTSGVFALIYNFDGCTIAFWLDGHGKVNSKSFILSPSVLGGGRIRPSVQSSTNSAEISDKIASLQVQMNRLQSELNDLRRLILNTNNGSANQSSFPSPTSGSHKN